MADGKDGWQIGEGLQIGELARQSGVSERTIRYYENIALLPAAHRSKNGYRQYRDGDVERLRFIRGARQLDLSLGELREVLALRDRGEAPCGRVAILLKQRVDEVEERILQLRALQADLEVLLTQASGLPEDIEMKACVCQLIRIRG